VAFSEAGYSPADRSRVYNSVFGSRITINGSNKMVDVSNCVFTADSTLGASEGGVGCNVSVPVASLHKFAFNADGSPVIGVNPAVDIADPSLVAGYPYDVSLDLNGNQRIWNARMDAGAVEADWRQVYADTLAKLNFTVTRADPLVVGGDTSIAISNGVVEAVWTSPGNRRRSYRFTVRVTGAGTLTVRVNGEAFASVTAADGAKELAFLNALASNSLSFAYAPGDGDTGAAELRNFSSGAAMTISFR